MSEKEDRLKQDQPSQEPHAQTVPKPSLTVTAPTFDKVQAHVDLDNLRPGQPTIPQDARKISPEKPDPNVQAPDFASVLKDRTTKPNPIVKAPEFTSKLTSDTPNMPPQKNNKESDPK